MVRQAASLLSPSWLAGINWDIGRFNLFLFSLMTMDVTSMFLRQPLALMGARFLHGFIGGMLVG